MTAMMHDTACGASCSRVDCGQDWSCPYACVACRKHEHLCPLHETERAMAQKLVLDPAVETALLTERDKEIARLQRSAAALSHLSAVE